MMSWDVMLVSHEASRTGAPRVAVEISKGFVDAGLQVLVVLRWDGPLRADFEASGATVIAETGRHLRVLLRRFRAGKRWSLAWENLMAASLLRRYRPKAVYLNTALSLPYVESALQMKLPVAVHLHEVDDWLLHALDRYPLTQEQAAAVRWAHCAQSSADLIRQRYPDLRSQFIPSGIDEIRIREAATQSLEFHLPAQFIVNCATADQRKGIDIWLRLCEAMHDSRSCSDLEFVWVGRITRDDLIEPFRHRPFFRKVHFTGEVSNPHPIIRCARLMVLTSRQDAYPLVVLEAQALGVPVVAFDVGSIDEQIPANHLVPAQDEPSLLSTVLRLLNEPAPVLAFEERRHGIAVARRLALELLAPIQKKG